LKSKLRRFIPKGVDPKYTKFAQPLAWFGTAVAAILFLVFVFKDPSRPELPPRPAGESPPAPPPPPPPPEPEVLSDAVVAADAALNVQVQMALAANPDTRTLKIKVSTRNGAVRIIGDVSGGSEKDNVTAVAKSVAGVTTFTNDITVHDRN
jgi:BON domain